MFVVEQAAEAISRILVVVVVEMVKKGPLL